MPRKRSIELAQTPHEHTPQLRCMAPRTGAEQRELILGAGHFVTISPATP